MAKAEISWVRVTPEGEKRQVYVHCVGKRWLFYWRHRRYERWQPLEHPPFEDWLELLDAVKRRVSRRRLMPNHIDRVEQSMRELFPDAQW
jgi:hypothetical protein